MNSVASTRGRFHLKPLAAAAALCLLAQPGWSQSFSQSGDNSTSPVNLLPFAGNPGSLDFGNNTIFIANSGLASFSALSGAQLSAGALSIAQGGTSTGTVLLSGINPGTSLPTKVNLGGTANRLEVGNWGVGTLTVQAGALLDATVNSGVCSTPGAACSSFVGNGAGSTGTLTITGAGSEVRTLRNFTVGQTAVFTVAGGYVADFGTPGGKTEAFVNVLAGGKLLTERASVASNNGLPNGNGAEKAEGTVVVSGSGSQWLLTPNTVDHTAAGLAIGINAGANGKVEVKDGGKLRIDGSGGSGPNDFLNIAGNGGHGTLSVSGAGSSVDLVGINTVLQVGRGGTGAQGSFSVLAGASASTLYLNVGRDGATGTMLIDGAGSTLTQSGVGSNQSYPPPANGAAFADIGRNGGSGTVKVSGGAQWLINDGGGDGRVARGSPGMALGRDANSTGSLLITGAGSRVEVTSTSMNPAVGVGDNYNPFVAVGYDNPLTSSGTLNVEAGGKLVLTGNALSTVADSRTTSLNIGGRSGFAATGSATVTGANSEIIVQGNDAYIGVGREAGGNGTLSVLAGGKVSSTSLAVGVSGTGTVNIDNASVALSGFRTNADPVTGAGMTVGRGSGGIGTLNMSSGALLSITPSTYTGGMAVGGDSYLDGGTGFVNMSGGSAIVINGPLVGNGITVGRTGTGTLTLSQASSIDAGSGGNIDFGRSPGGQGNLSLSGGSTLHANTIQFGGRNDVDAGGIATASVSGAGSLLHADGDTARLSVGRGGTGVLSLSDQAKIMATFVNVGRAGGNGTLTVDGGVIEASGQKTLAGTDYGAGISVGTRSGTGSLTLANASHATISNLGSAGAQLSVGGNPDNPLGTGTLAISGGSTLTMQAASGQANARIGHSGVGITAIDGASKLDAGDGNVYVGQQPSSVGILHLSNGSTLNAGYVGVGVTQAYDGTQHNGGIGTLVVNDSTINTGKFELGAGSTLSGNNGVLNVVGDVVIGGIVSPGNSPGRIRINCNIITLPGSQLILDVEEVGNGSYAFDELVIGHDATYSLQPLNIVFNFVGNTNPEAFAATGKFNLDTFLLSANGNVESGLSSVFAPGQTWDNVVSSSLISAQSSAYNVTTLQLQSNGSFAVVAVPVPEPSTWGLMFAGLMAVGGYARWRRRGAAQA